MRKTLYLHIGRAKTGSSAIQVFLWKNRAKLLQNGILYPKSVMHHRASHQLAYVFQPEFVGHALFSGATPSEVYQRAFAEADEHRLRSMVASSENLFLVPPKDVVRCLPDDWDVRVICYVRRQDHVLASSLVQEIKTGHVGIDTDIDEYVSNPIRLGLLDYSETLGKWAKVFGRENILVRPYHEAGTEWSICQDFADTVSLDTSGFEFPQERVNPSPARDVLDFIRMVNASKELSPARKPLVRIPLLQASEDLGAKGEFDSHRMISAEMRTRVLARFAVSNAALARDYLGRTDGVLFDDSVKDDSASCAEYAGMDLNRLAYMVASVLCSLQEQISVIGSKKS